MIRKAIIDDKENLCSIFSETINSNTAYISHGELQMGIAIDTQTLSPNYKELWTKYIHELIENEKTSSVYVYEEDGIIYGFIVGTIEEDGGKPFGIINDICVIQSTRHKGIGSQLMDMIFEWFKSKNIESFYLESGVHNHSAHAFFEKRGFEVVSQVFRLRK